MQETISRPIARKISNKFINLIGSALTFSPDYTEELLSQVEDIFLGNHEFEEGDFVELKKIQDLDLSNDKINHLLGVYYHVLRKDEAKMIKYYNNAASQKNVDSMNNLGSFYQSQGDEEKAIEYFQMASDAGNFCGLDNLGFYYQGKGNYEKAEFYYRLSAEKGSVSAISNLGYLYEILKDYENMKKYYLLAIDNGVPVAANNLANYYKTISDPENSLKYYIIGAELGDANSMIALGDHYKTLNQKEDVEKYYLMAAMAGKYYVYQTLANFYYQLKDYDNFKKYSLEAIYFHDLTAMYYLAVYYKDIEKDYKNAIKYYLMAIQHRDIDSMVEIGECYEALKDNDTAIKYYEMAMKYNDSRGASHIGKLYLSLNETEQLEYFNKITSGEIDPVYIGTYFLNEKKFPEAEKFLLIGVEKGCGSSANNLGTLYYHEKDYDKMMKYFLLALELKDKKAIENLTYLFEKNTIMLYTLLIPLVDSFEAIATKIKELKENDIIVQYYLEHEVDLIQNECPICLDILGNIKFPQCGHEICVNCYFRTNKKCYYRCSNNPN